MIEGIAVLALVFIAGSLAGVGVSAVVFIRMAKYRQQRDEELRTQSVELVEERVGKMLDRMMSRFEKVEERLEFSEDLLVERIEENQ